MDSMIVVSSGTHGSNGGGLFGYTWIPLWWCLGIHMDSMIVVSSGTHISNVGGVSGTYGSNGGGVFGYI